MNASQLAAVTSWDQSGASMPMLPDRTTADDIAEPRAVSAPPSPATGCSGGIIGGKLALFFLVGIQVLGIVAAALAWFYSCRQVSWSE